MFESLLHRISHAHGTRESGQILVIVAAAFVGMVAMLALVFDGANAYVVRRQLQTASDAAALAGANLIQTPATGTCSPTGGNPPGSPYADVVAAAKASVAENLPDYPLDEVRVTCPSGWDNYAVSVELDLAAPRFFSVIWSTSDLTVRADATAINGYFTHRNYSVVTLNPSGLGHPQGRDGCPSVLFSGGPTVIMDSAMHVNSGCLGPDGGALGTNGNAATLTMGRGAPIRIHGDYVPGPLTINPPPLTRDIKIDDPFDNNEYSLPGTAAAEAWFAGLERYKAPVNENCNGCWITLKPGVYEKGITLGGQAKAVMWPGVYRIEGGGLKLGAQVSLFTVRDGLEKTSNSTWASTDCPNDGSCGVLIFNTTSGGQPMGTIDINAGATVKVRSLEQYDGVLFWQDKYPEPTAASAQPAVTLGGGGNVDMTGTVYAPSARILMRGSAGGSGGSVVQLALRFISYDLQFNGNSTFHFIYVADIEQQPMDYGLVK